MSPLAVVSSVGEMRTVHCTPSALSSAGSNHPHQGNEEERGGRSRHVFFKHCLYSITTQKQYLCTNLPVAGIECNEQFVETVPHLFLGENQYAGQVPH
jgi:hypothetical protein